ncbi:signal transduction histidine kinase [Mesoflavibacter sabulilitoris]|uniref:histidine kinase n=1 Tax=Mesoflavibacter zeaxanthinifaciens subsp. sabulilitoris TaxID=1520893 RepID=A0A2T1N600_9FLAO|nr:tetratricopeptide repeat-containing sensor histidine kinase [Mesoflavibacter zeaxanthinifaciens]MBB3123362.1 signal transduction histidine kinase [Mesoflavibacter zeaxanthinifaciens subsp. sabulilitoris]PSG87007.1 hypothetical protein C7H61_12920 [Mesoflavibacter zeaxanthinifaciens subsp. sabulilitoris]
MKIAFLYCVAIMFFLVSFCVNAQNEPLKKTASFYLNKAKKLSQNQRDSVFYYLDKSYALAVQNNNDSLKLLALHNKVQIYYQYKMFKEACKFNGRLDSIAKKLNDTLAMYNAEINYGRLENALDNSHTSTEYYKKALALALEIKNNKKVLIAYGNIGNNYMYEAQYKLAETFFLDCMSIIESLNKKETNDNILNVAMVHVNLVFIYTELNNKEKALEYLDKTDQVYNGRYFKGRFEINELKGLTYAHFKDYNKAIYYFKKQLEISKGRKDKTAIEHSLLNLAELHVSVEEYEKACSYFNAYEASHSANNSEDEILSDNAQIYQIALNSYKGANQYQKALKYAELLNKTLDTLHKIEVTNTFAEYGKKYQTEKKIQENELLKKENEIKVLEVQQQKKARNYLILLSILGLVALGATYSRFKAKKKTANLLAEQNTIINQQKEELEKSNANKQKLFGIIAHDLVNPFNAILGYTNLLDEDYNNFTDTERKEFISTINKYANNNYNLTRTLLDWAKVQQDKLVVNKTQVNCKDIVENALRPYLVMADKKEIKIVTNVPNDITINADQNMMQTVIGNLFVNAIKFTPEGGTITFNLEKLSDGTISLEIEDNGIGMTQEQLNNIFDITKVASIKGTNQEKGHGLGLILCKELMELQKGTLQIFSQLNKGSKAVVTI